MRSARALVLLVGLAGCADPAPITAPSGITWVARIFEDVSGEPAEAGTFVPAGEVDRYPPKLDAREVLLGFSQDTLQAAGVDEPKETVAPLQDACEPELPSADWAVRVPGDGSEAVEIAPDGAPRLTASWLPPRCGPGYYCVSGRCEPGFAGVSAGVDHACAWSADGKLYCWGRNELGAVSARIESFVTSASLVEGLGPVVQADGGAFHTCARLEDGTVWCWGAGGAGQLGQGSAEDSRTPVKVVGVEDARFLAVASQHACAVVGAAGEVVCWGSNIAGQLGDGSTEVRLQPVRVPGLAVVQQVSVGDLFSCAADASGKVTCWGEGSTGELGPRGGAAPSRAVAVDSGAIQLSSGQRHTCARFESGEVLCWGDDPRGQLGGGVPALPAAAAEVKAAGRWSCARLVDDRVYCWGSDQYGQRGEEGLLPNLYNDPTPLILAPTARGLGLGNRFGCMLDDALRVKCWGDNGYGQLGNGVSEFVAEPALALAFDAVDMAAGESHTCLLAADGRVSCFGGNYFGELGQRTRSVWEGIGPVAGISGAEKIDAGRNHTCALRTGGSVVCWGRNLRGEVSVGTVEVAVPVTEIVVPEATDIATGDNFSCAVTGGEVWCWGDNDLRQLGRDTQGAPGEPAPVPDIAGAVQVSAGQSRACARLEDGAVWCWGVGVAPALWMLDVDDVQLGRRFGCARRTDGAVLCWGLNDHGQLADGTRQTRQSPDVVEGLTGVADLRLGSSHACARMQDGRLLCWGDDDWHQQGDGDRDDALRPAPVAGLEAVRAVAAGVTHTVAVLEDGSVYAWGWNPLGQLGVAPSGVGAPASLVLGLP